MSNGFWQSNQPQQPTQEMVLDEQALTEIQGEEFNIYEDEEEDTASLMVDANLRLEQGRLYQMVLQNDIFAETNADPRAIKNVQREIRKYVRERMETMLGIRQEAQVQIKEQVRHPADDLNDMEVAALKMVASKVTKGASESAPTQTVLPTVQIPTKKDGITAISGTVKQNSSVSQSKPAQKSVPKQPLKGSPVSKTERSGLTKPIDQMSEKELADHNKAVEERQLKMRATAQNAVPHPNAQQLEMLYTQIAGAGAAGIVNAGSGAWRPY